MISCPSEKQLQQWLSGGLSVSESQLIEAHVETCRDVCQPLLDSFSGFEDAPPADAGEMPAPHPADSPKLPGYEILGELGKGGMGVVYKARHRRMDRLVAIKVLPPGLVRDAAAVARFEREVKAAARLQHPNIVAAYDAAEADGVHFLVMEYVAGIDLAALVRHKGPLPIGQAVDFVLQAARGLDYAHRHGIVHRDIKPGNLLVDGEGAVKVLDMGLARFEMAQEAGLTDLTGMGQIMGTVDYMAPEQALDTHHADARADIYALGITLWYLLTRRPAYMGENALGRLLAHREQPIPSLRAARPEVSPELEALFMRMVAKKPENRPQTMTEVIAELGRVGIAHHEPHEGRRVGIAHHANQPVSQSAKASSTGAIAVVDGDGGQCPPYAPTLALNAAEFDTDPKTDQSLLALSTSPARTPPRRRRHFRIAAALVGLAAVAAAAFVIRVQTGEGEIVVESEADGISVDILRDGEPVKEDWQIHAGADNRWVVRSGIVNIKLPADLRGEFTLDQDTARLARDGKILVKITRKKPANAPAIAAADRDRAAAEWVVAQGGMVGYIKMSGGRGKTRSAAELPSEPFHLHHVNLWGAKTVRSADLDHLVGLPRLEELLLGNTAIDAEAIRRLVKMPRLFALELGETRVKSSVLVALAPLSKLSDLTLNASQNDDDWKAVEGLAQLRRLTLYGNGASADDLRRLGQLKQLRALWLRYGERVDEQAIERLQSANPLCRVIVGDKEALRAIGDDPVVKLAQRLRAKGAKLDLQRFPDNTIGAVATEADLLAGNPPPQITAITIPEGVSLDDEELRRLSCPWPLYLFTAEGGAGADELAAALASQTMLASVRLAASDLTDAGLARFKTLPSLVSLDVTGTKVTQQGVEALRAALPDCEIAWNGARSSPPPTTDRDRAAAEWVLAQGGKVGLVVDGKGTPLIERREDLPAGRFKVINAVLAGVATMCDDDLDRFENVDDLLYFNLVGTPIGREALSRLATLPTLQVLNIGGTKITTSDLPALAALPRLHSLAISAKSQVDDQWAGLRPLESLRDLIVYEASADDLHHLAELKQLRTIWLHDAPADVDERVVAELQAANPLCRVLVGLDGAVTSLGRDLVAELARRLLKKKARLGITPFPPGSGPLLTANIEAETVAGRPFDIRRIQLEAGTALDDEELDLLRAPSSLTGFEAYGAVGADRCAAALAGQPLLTGIFISGSGLTDAGLEHLKRMPSLVELDIRETRVTAVGVEALRKALPNCKIHANPPAAKAAE